MHLLITAGPTREFFDTVRYLSNASSGKMGFAIAQAGAGRGHRVTLVSGPVSLETPSPVERIDVTSAAEMLDACLKVFPACNAAVMTAAVSDYRPARRSENKMKRDDRSLKVTLEPTEDISARLADLKGHRIVVGFALEDHDAMLHAENKLKRKYLDAIVLNGPENIGRDSGTVRILTAQDGWHSPIQGSKHELAGQIILLIEALARAASPTADRRG